MVYCSDALILTRIWKLFFRHMLVILINTDRMDCYSKGLIQNNFFKVQICIISLIRWHIIPTITLIYRDYFQIWFSSTHCSFQKAGNVNNSDKSLQKASQHRKFDQVFHVPDKGQYVFCKVSCWHWFQFVWYKYLSKICSKYQILRC